jgi:cell division protein FtsI (penicillin-binding protein 3)
MDFEGEGQPVVPQPKDKNWSNILLWMALIAALGYPTQTLAFL